MSFVCGVLFKVSFNRGYTAACIAHVLVHWGIAGDITYSVGVRADMLMSLIERPYKYKQVLQLGELLVAESVGKLENSVCNERGASIIIQHWER